MRQWYVVHHINSNGNECWSRWQGSSEEQVREDFEIEHPHDEILDIGEEME